MEKSERPRHGPVPPDAVVPPRRTLTLELRPEHLYKAVALAFLLAVLHHYLGRVVQTLLLAYAAVILAVLLNALVQALPLRRTWVAALLGLAILAAVGAALWFGLPVLFRQLKDLAQRVPELTELLRSVESWIRSNTGLNVELVGSRVEEFLGRAFLQDSGGGSAVLSRAQGLLGILFVPLLILFGALYAVGNPNDRLLSPLLRAVPRDRRLAFRRIFQLLGDRLLGWAKGVVLGMIGVGILSYIGYSLAGVPNALVLAVIAALTEAIPLIGPWIGGGIATVVGLLEGPTTGLYAALVALVVQQIENNLLIPWVMAREAEVHPFVTLFALVLFGSMFGFLGVLLALPLVLLIWTVVEVLWVERAIDTDEDAIEPVVEG